MPILKFVAHSKKVISIASDHGWRPGARYTNMRDIKAFEFAGIGFLDINWKNYQFARHLEVIANALPFITIARDVENISELDTILREAEQLSRYSQKVVIVPKDVRLAGRMSELIPSEYLLGYSVPTKYGGTLISPEYFDRPVHLLGGRPDIQRRLGDTLKVFSLDCNRFTLDAGFGDYFDGETFRPHPKGGYANCLTDSIRNINRLWDDYKPHEEALSILRTA